MIKFVKEYVNNMQGFLRVKETARVGRGIRDGGFFLLVEFMQGKRWFVISGERKRERKREALYYTWVCFFKFFIQFLQYISRNSY